MIKKFYLIVLSIMIYSINLIATDITITNIRMVNRTDLGTQPYVLFDLSWKNAWKNDKNHDAVWIFGKFNNNPWEHPLLETSGHAVLKNRIDGCPTPRVKASKDSIGLWVYLDDNYRGDVDIKVKMMLDTSRQKMNWRKAKDFQVYAIEMVQIPGGPFTLGDPASESDQFATFYRSDNQGKRKGLYSISSEEPIDVGPGEDNLYYWSETSIYNGDQKGTIPAEFPKGTEPFYIMKYELTQGQYADFLTQLSESWSSLRNPLGGKNYYEKKGAIYLKDGKYHAKYRDRPMNFVSFTDGLAYTDWAGLRPITELEYEKAARGPSTPKPGEFVWGTSDYSQLERYVNLDGNTVTQNGFTEDQLDDNSRAVFGASYYWVMDLSGSLWEKVITIGNPIGRSFKGSHGDGLLNHGHSTNSDWPKSDNEEGGFGYRGGGYYEIGTEYSDYNPHSPIGYRYYGAWSGGPRSIAYGYRAGRSADQN